VLSGLLAAGEGSGDEVSIDRLRKARRVGVPSPSDGRLCRPGTSERKRLPPPSCDESPCAVPALEPEPGVEIEESRWKREPCGVAKSEVLSGLLPTWEGSGDEVSIERLRGARREVLPSPSDGRLCRPGMSMFEISLELTSQALC